MCRLLRTDGVAWSCLCLLQAPIQRFADYVAGYFVQGVLTASVVTWIVWFTVGYSHPSVILVSDPSTQGFVMASFAVKPQGALHQVATFWLFSCMVPS